MTLLTELSKPALHDRLLGHARALFDEAREDRRAINGAVAALGVGLMLGLFLRPEFAEGGARQSHASGLARVDAGLVRTEGLDILVSARAPDEGRIPRVHTRLHAPVFGDPGPAPRLQRVSHIVEPDAETLLEDESEPLFLERPRLDDCGDDCDRMEDPPEDLEPL